MPASKSAQNEAVLFRVHFTDETGQRCQDEFLATSPDEAVKTLRNARPLEHLAVTKIKRVRS